MVVPCLAFETACPGQVHTTLPGLLPLVLVPVGKKDRLDAVYLDSDVELALIPERMLGDVCCGAQDGCSGTGVAVWTLDLKLVELKSRVVC